MSERVSQAVRLAEMIIELEDDLIALKAALKALFALMTEKEKEEYKACLAIILRDRIRGREELFNVGW